MITLTAEELVDDRSLVEEKQDRFGHKDFAAELADMVTTIKAPANIALFAPWGSGKSGLSNLLRKKLEEKPGWGKELKFAHFDAFKFAEAPLRRNFIGEVARQFQIDDDEFDSGLYVDTTTNDLKADKEKVKSAIKFIFWGLAIAVVTCSVIAGALSWIGDDSFKNVIKGLLIPALPVAAIIGTCLGLVTKGFTVTSSKSAPSTAEEFEKTFKNLVTKAEASRLVIFVDELDRCASHEVAETLETIKTFLEVKGCVFVVAADHQVLEQALRKRVRQETPIDPQNPYFSAGSSYLDKIFQFQLSLPELKPRRLTNFAIELVENRPGLWQRIDRLDDVISVLVPTHVTSPRRVKVLLNSFAISYRLAERRAEQELLDPDISSRASEVAKLACLRCEFPIFADELNRDAQIVQALQDVGLYTQSKNGWDEKPDALASEVAESSDQSFHLLQKAASYFVGQSPVAELLTDEDSDSKTEKDAEARTKKAHAAQLTRYLLRTRNVDGPGDDLVHLEGSGVGLELTTAEASELERAAVDDDFRAAETVIESLDVKRRPDAIRLLSQLLGETSVKGIEGDNVLSVLFKSVERFRDAVEPALNPVVAAVSQHHPQNGIRKDCLPGALLLARMRGGADGARLRSQVLRTDGALEDSQVCIELIEDAEKLPSSQSDSLATAVERVLLREPNVLRDHLDKLSREALDRALDAGQGKVKASYQAHYASSQKLSDEEIADDTEREELEQNVFEDDPAASIGKVMSALAEAKRYLESERVMRLMIFIDHLNARNEVENRLDAVSPLESPESIGPILRATGRRNKEYWSKWLDAIPKEHALTPQETPYFQGLAKGLWAAATGDQPPAPETVTSAITALKATGALGASPIAEELSTVDLSKVENEGQRKKRDQLFGMGIVFANGKLTDLSSVNDAMLRSSILVLETDQDFGDPAVSDLSDQHRAASEHFEKFALEGLASSDADLIDEARHALESAPDWLANTTRDKLRLKASLAGARNGWDPPDPKWIAEIVTNQGNAVLDEIAEWLGLINPVPTDAREVLTLYSHTKPNPTFAAAMRSYSEGLGPAGRYELISELLEAEPTEGTSIDFLSACNLSETLEDKVAKQLIRAFDEASNDEQRRRILRLWQILSPSKQAIRWKLVESIWLPLIRGNQSEGRAALEHFDLLVPAPSGYKKKLVDELMQTEVKDSSLRDRLDKKMRQQHWIKKSGLFGRSRERIKHQEE